MGVIKKISIFGIVIIICSILVRDSSESCEKNKPQQATKRIIGMRRPPGSNADPVASRLIRVITPPPPIRMPICEPLLSPCAPMSPTHFNPMITEVHLPCPTCNNQVVYYINNTHHHYYGGHPHKQ